MRIQLVIFDMDGVIFEGDNFWLELHRRYGTEREGLELASKYLVSDYTNLANLVAGRLWKGKPASVYNLMVKRRLYQPGVRKVFGYLKRHNIHSAILSSGPYHLALRAQKDLGIDAVWANRLSINNDAITGEVEVMVRDYDKKDVGLGIIRQFNAEPSRTVFVGDSDADAALAEVVGLPVAYDCKSERLRKACKYALNYGELERLTDIIGNAQSEQKRLSVSG